MADRDSDHFKDNRNHFKDCSSNYFPLFFMLEDLSDVPGQTRPVYSFHTHLRNTFKEIKPKIMLPPFENDSQNR